MQTKEDRTDKSSDKEHHLDPRWQERWVAGEVREKRLRFYVAYTPNISIRLWKRRCLGCGNNIFMIISYTDGNFTCYLVYRYHPSLGHIMFHLHFL